MKKVLTLSLTALALCATPVFAKIDVAERAAAVPAARNIMGFPVTGGTGCLIENAQVTVSFNGVEQDATAVRTKFDAKMAEAEKVMKAAELDKYEIQSMNYNISPQNYGNMSAMYQYNGSMSYTILPASKATAVMEQLTKKGFQPSVNVNAYRNGNMPCPQQPTVKE